MMIRAADLLAEARRAGDLGGGAAVSLDWSHVAERIRDDATDDWDDEANVEALGESGVERGAWKARLLGGRPGRGRRVETTGRSRGIVIATGTDPAVPDVRGLSDMPYETNRDVVRWKISAGDGGRARWRSDRCRARPGLGTIRRGGHPARDG